MTQEVLTAIQEAVGSEVFAIWFLIGAALVFFMQAGFAMVETGFTRAKNAGNIIMKNLILTGLILYSIWYFVPQQRLSCQGLWQREQNFYLTVFILQ